MGRDVRLCHGCGAIIPGDGYRYRMRWYCAPYCARDLRDGMLLL